ncbi:MAG: cyclodeaminase/cyclohydrolase family protein [Phycisphaeraceae bacterium]|nr:cyclodeaminase/cyclohydrolase family protein [Phycisphaeraceae bacterium]
MPPLETLTVRELMDEIAAKSPAPGGGAVASVVGSLAAALGNMVVAYSVGKKQFADHAGALEAASRRLTVARSMMLRLADEDAAAYQDFNELSRLPDDDERRKAEYPNAIQRCVQAPRAVLAATVDVLRLLETLAPITNRHLRSDLAIAAILCDTAARAASWNVRVNVPMLSSDAQKRIVLDDTARSVDECRRRAAAVEAACDDGQAAPTIPA